MPFDPTTAAIRFGHGLPQVTGAPHSVPEMLAALARPDVAMGDHPITPTSVVADLLVRREAAGRTREDGPAEMKAYQQTGRDLTDAALAAARTTLTRALVNPDGFRERLAAFWGNHFTTALRARPNRFLSFAFMDEAIRPHLAGTFADLLTAATLHPTMLSYLDQTASFGPNSRQGKRTKRGLNENLARELLELHTMGVGAGYAQDDVRQLAELLTGLAVDPALQLEFQDRRAEPGAETVLGKTYDGKGLAPIRAVLSDLARRPETARHIARKLAVHFVADDPDPQLIDALYSAYANSGGDLIAVYAALLNHPAAWLPKAQKARQPYDFMIAALRALDLSGTEVAKMALGPFSRMILDPMAAMGQPFKTAPGPDGWAEEAEAWITPQGLAARITWAMAVPARLVRPLPDPRDLAHRCLGPRASESLLWAVARAENIREGVGLVLVSPEFNRR